MKNFIWILLGSTLVFGTMLANAASSSASRAGHFFVGGAIGDEIPNKVDYSVSSGTPQRMVHHNPSSDISSTKLSSFFGQIDGGFAWEFNGYELSVDGYIQGSPENKQSSKAAYLDIPGQYITSINVEFIQKSLGYGIEIKPGYHFSNKIKISVIVGYGWSPYSMTATTRIVASDDPTDYFQYRESKDLNGGHVISGLQLEYQLREKLSLKVIYEHDFYSNDELAFHRFGTSTQAVNLQFSANIDGLKHSNAIYVGVSYPF